MWIFPIHSEETRWLFVREGSRNGIPGSFLLFHAGEQAVLVPDWHQIRWQACTIAPFGLVAPSKRAMLTTTLPSPIKLWTPMGSWKVITLMLIDANWRAFTVIWKVKENILKVIFKIRSHASLREEEISAPGFNTNHSYCGGPMVTEVISTQGHTISR